MKNEQDAFRDIAEIRSMMERSSKFLALSGWAGIMAGIYALAGAYIAYSYLYFNPHELINSDASGFSSKLTKVTSLAVAVLILAASTAIFLSYKRAHSRGEKVWNATSRRLLNTMAVPLITGGILMLIMISKSLTGLLAPLSLLFYGLALYNAGKLTIPEVRILGFIQIFLGLLSAYFIDYALIFWAIGFGACHIIYGIYMHYRYKL